MGVQRKFNYMNLLLILVFVVGLGILLYPNISDFFNQKNSSKSINEYDETVAQMNEETRQVLFKETESYNTTLLSNPVGRFADMTEEMKDDYYGTLDIDGSGMMCYLKIDKLGLNLPVYHGTTEDVLQKYVGHIEGTSLPIGGQGTHCGLSGHRGLPSAVLFTNLDRMEVGDVFSIIVLGEEHFYQIDQIVTVLPNDLSPLAIDPEMDYCTLVTCTPYGENTHRLMIRGARIEDEEAEEIIDNTESATLKYGLTREQVVNAIAAVMGTVFMFVAVPILLFPPVPTPKAYIRPWDDNIEEVCKAAIKVSEMATRANWEMDSVTHEADTFAKRRRWDDTLKYADKLTEDDLERPWDDYDFYDESVDYSEEEEVRLWDDKVLEKVDQDWSVFDRDKNQQNLKFENINEIIDQGKVEESFENLDEYFKEELRIGFELLEKSKKGK
ncbi:sortase A [Pseudobutyrivibrio xylanivorans DSM 14809]|uniref:Sortase A n=2 Tax=Pseudobutyrivibrio xylanivorans TaxID=185007 RepID=A0A1M6BAP5_PSEXY|nr:sortase A [Pseudobutyrivibrio xylanivorans DSM 14809]